jgi:tRNA pseudouridine38-40 synthase
MRNIRIVLSYDGTDYHGWQRQPRKKTVQGMVEDALARLAGKTVSLTGAGRTDAGVHARAQVANVKASFRLSDAELQKALNAILPDDIRVTEVGPASPEFHARRDAVSKVYQYRICRDRFISPFVFRYALHFPSPLDVGRMREAAALFVREDDFSGFSSNRELYPVRNVTRSDLVRRGDELVYTIEANGFLRYMVRTIVGTLLEVGRGRIAPAAIEDIFRGKKRTLASPTAPAKGLCLLSVLY